MPELRQDPSTHEWVIIATERARRPDEFRKPVASRADSHSDAGCVFCPGNEHRTPQEVFSLRAKGKSDEPGWAIRVIPNKFPALQADATALHNEPDVFFHKMGGFGIHEVIIETPRHDRVMAHMTETELVQVMWVYRERYRKLRTDPRVKLILIFKDHGASAGTSISHPHAQLVATPVIPLYVRKKYEVAIEHFDSTGRCIYCDIVREEKKAGERIVLETDRFLVFHPFASRSPFETWIAPKRHNSCFGSCADEELADLAYVLKNVLGALYVQLDNPDFNFVIHTAPVEDEAKPYYLWHLQILPRLTTPAGFEIGTGVFINTVVPEESARFMREALGQSVTAARH